MIWNFTDLNKWINDGCNNDVSLKITILYLLFNSLKTNTSRNR